MASPSFVHLDVRSFFSLKDGAFSPEDVARRAAELGMPAVALTDRDGLYGAARFIAACEREGVRPILGATLTVRNPHGGALQRARRRCGRPMAPGPRGACARFRRRPRAANRRPSPAAAQPTRRSCCSLGTIGAMPTSVD